MTGGRAAVGFEMPVPERDLLLGVALSGGGSFFEQYRAAISQNFETCLTWRQLLSFRWMNSALAARTLAEIFQKRLFADARMQDISMREKARSASDDSVSAPCHSPCSALTSHAFPASWKSEPPPTRRSSSAAWLEGVFPDSRTVTGIILRHTDAKWAADMSDLPPACKAEPRPLASPEAVRERIGGIPTALQLPSECDRQLLVTAATKLVAERQDVILEFLNRP